MALALYCPYLEVHAPVRVVYGRPRHVAVLYGDHVDGVVAGACHVAALDVHPVALVQLDGLPCVSRAGGQCTTEFCGKGIVIQGRTKPRRTDTAGSKDTTEHTPIQVGGFPSTDRAPDAASRATPQLLSPS